MGQWIAGHFMPLLIATWWLPCGLIWWLWCGRSDPAPSIRDSFDDFEDDGRDLN